MPKRQASAVWHRTEHVYVTILAVAFIEDARACSDAAVPAAVSGVVSIID